MFSLSLEGCIFFPHCLFRCPKREAEVKNRVEMLKFKPFTTVLCLFGKWREKNPTNKDNKKVKPVI